MPPNSELESLIVHQKILRALSALVLAFFATLVAPAQADDLVSLDHGHVDVFNAQPNGDTLSLVLHESIDTPGQYWNPAKVVLTVNESMYTTASKNLDKVATPGYFLPQQPAGSELWPGWDTASLAQAGYSHSEIEFTAVEGPGKVFLWQQSGLGGTIPVFSSGEYFMRPGSIIAQAAPAHAHANWLFSAPGTYKMTARVSAQKDGVKVTSEPSTYTWIVGNTAVPHDDASTAPAPAPTGSAPTSASASDNAAGNAAPSAQDSPAVVTHTEKVCKTHTAVGGSYTIAANTHVHPNWVFTAPGSYTVNITETATLKSGQRVSAPLQLRFNVGGSGSANSGHYDVGAMLDNGKLIAAMKDPGEKWNTSPQSVVFGLGGASKVSAPAGIEFIAKAGSPIWMISSTQVAGVPWLGANTMHPSVISGTTGPVTWTLNSVSGPGALAVFTSGNLGAIVGQKWFGGVTQSCETVTFDQYGRRVDAERNPLAFTGANVATSVAAAAFLTLAGAVVVRRRYAKNNA